MIVAGCAWTLLQLIKKVNLFVDFPVALMYCILTGLVDMGTGRQALLSQKDGKLIACLWVIYVYPVLVR